MRADLRASGQNAPGRYNRRMYRALVIALIVMLAGLQYRLWIADGGWAEVHRLNVAKAELDAANTKADARNESLQAEIVDLRAGERAMEGRARADIGMVEQGETFYLTIAPKPAR